MLFAKLKSDKKGFECSYCKQTISQTWCMMPATRATVKLREENCSKDQSVFKANLSNLVRSCLQVYDKKRTPHMA